MIHHPRPFPKMSSTEITDLADISSKDFGQHSLDLCSAHCAAAALNRKRKCFFEAVQGDNSELFHIGNVFQYLNVLGNVFEATLGVII